MLLERETFKGLNKRRLKKILQYLIVISLTSLEVWRRHVECFDGSYESLLVCCDVLCCGKKSFGKPSFAPYMCSAVF